MAITLIQTVTVGSGGASSIDFTSIPGTYTDLQVVYSMRTSRNTPDPWDDIDFKVNGSATGYAAKILFGVTGTAASANGLTTSGWGGWSTDALTTSNTFSNTSLYMPNYASSTAKSFSVDTVIENNSASDVMGISGISWSGTSAITSISIYARAGATIQQYSSASLYGILKGSSGGVTVS